MYARHDGVQFLVHFLSAPAHAHGVLCHFQTRSCHATGIHCLTRCEELFGSNELVDSLCGASHVRYFCYAERLISQDGISVSTVELVLCGAGQIDVGLDFPWLLSWEELAAGEFFFIRRADVVSAGTQFQHVFNLLGIESGLVEDVSVWS